MMTRLIRIFLLFTGLLPGLFRVHGQSKPVPKVLRDDLFLSAENMPAYSGKENAFLIVHNRHSCCYSSQTTLLKMTASLQTVKQFLLYPGEDSLYLANIDQSQIISEVERIVAEGRYEPMEQIWNDNFSIDHQRNTTRYLVEFWYEKGRSRQVAVDFPDLILPGMCCNGDIRSDEHCQTTPNSFNLWIDKSRSLILLEYGTTSQANGCDAGPFYVVKKLGDK